MYIEVSNQSHIALGNNGLLLMFNILKVVKHLSGDWEHNLLKKEKYTNIIVCVALDILGWMILIFYL